VHGCILELWVPGRYDLAMAYQTVTYDREMLYQEVWTEPMFQLAKKYGLSDVGLAKICRKLKIPRADRGYWGQTAGRKAS